VPPFAARVWGQGLLTGVLYALVLVSLFWPVMSGRDMFFAGDIVQHYLPWEHFAQQELRQGTLPHLHPGMYCGHPLLAEGQAALLYPPTRLVYALSSDGSLAGNVQAFHLDLLLHWVIAGLGIWYAATIMGLPWRTAALAGLLGCCAGLFLVLPVNVPILRVAVWTGWLIGSLTLFLRSNQATAWLAMTLLWGFCFLAGGPQMTALLIVGCAIYALASLIDIKDAPHPLVALLGALAAPVVGALLAAIQLLPTYFLYQQSAIQRFAGAEALQYSATWLQMASWLIPPSWLGGLPPGHPLPSYSPPALWIGTIGAALSLAGLVSTRAPWRLKIWLSVILVFALGALTPVYPLVIAMFPPLGAFRAPDRYLAIAIVPLCLLAAWALEHFLSEHEEGVPSAFPTWTPSAIAGFLGLGVAISLASWGLRLDSSTSMAEGAWQMLRAMGPDAVLQLVGLALLGGLLWAQQQGRLSGVTVVCVCSLFTLIQWGLVKDRIPPLRTLPRSQVLETPAVAQRIQEQLAEQPSVAWGRLVQVQPFSQAARLFGGMEALDPGSKQLMTDYLSWHHGAGDKDAQLARLHQLHPNSGTLWGMSYVGGIASLYTARMDQYLEFMDSTQLQLMLRMGTRPQGTTLLDLAGGRYLLLPESIPRTLMPTVIVDDQVVGINTKARPLAWLMQPDGFLPESTETLESLVRLRLDPGKVLVLDSLREPRPAMRKDAVLPVVSWHWSNSNTLQLEVETFSKCWLIVCLQSLDGWTARVNQRQVPLHRAWGTFLAIPLDAGPQRIELSYLTPGFLPGLQISLVTLAALIAGFLWYGPAGPWLRERFQVPEPAAED